MLALFARQPYEDNVCQLVACNRLKGPYRVCRSVGKKSLTLAVFTLLTFTPRPKQTELPGAPPPPRPQEPTQIRTQASLTWP